MVKWWLIEEVHFQYKHDNIVFFLFSKFCIFLVFSWLNAIMCNFFTFTKFFKKVLLRHIHEKLIFLYVF